MSNNLAYLLMMMMLMKKKKKKEEVEMPKADLITTMLRQMQMQQQQQMEHQMRAFTQVMEALMNQMKAMVREMVAMKEDQRDRVLKQLSDTLAMMQQQIEELQTMMWQRPAAPAEQQGSITRLAQEIKALKEIMKELQAPQIGGGQSPIDKETIKDFIDYWLEKERLQLKKLELETRKKLSEARAEEVRAKIDKLYDMLKEFGSRFVGELSSAIGAGMRARVLLELMKQYQGDKRELLSLLEKELGPEAVSEFVQQEKENEEILKKLEELEEESGGSEAPQKEEEVQAKVEPLETPETPQQTETGPARKFVRRLPLSTGK